MDPVTLTTADGLNLFGMLASSAPAGKGAREIDLDGATVLPGLIDTHPHLLHFGGSDVLAADAEHVLEARPATPT